MDPPDGSLKIGSCAARRTAARPGSSSQLRPLRRPPRSTRVPNSVYQPAPCCRWSATGDRGNRTVSRDERTPEVPHPCPLYCLRSISGLGLVEQLIARGDCDGGRGGQADTARAHAARGHARQRPDRAHTTGGTARDARGRERAPASGHGGRASGGSAGGAAGSCRCPRPMPLRASPLRARALPPRLGLRDLRRHEMCHLPPSAGRSAADAGPRVVTQRLAPREFILPIPASVDAGVGGDGRTGAKEGWGEANPQCPGRAGRPGHGLVGCSSPSEAALPAPPAPRWDGTFGARAVSPACHGDAAAPGPVTWCASPTSAGRWRSPSAARRARRSRTPATATRRFAGSARRPTTSSFRDSSPTAPRTPESGRPGRT
jgi:hypothetical protein